MSLLFRERHAELVRPAVLLLGSRPAAEDVVQDVFTRLCTRDYLAIGGNPLAYVRTAVVNGCRSALRRTSAACRAGKGRAHSSRRHRGPPRTRCCWPRTAWQVIAALQALPARRREVLVLRYWLGLTDTEIAEVLGISRATVSSTAARALAALSRRLGEES